MGLREDAASRRVLLTAASTCDVNIVMPSYIDAGLWYRYDADAKIIRVAPRKELDAGR